MEPGRCSTLTDDRQSYISNTPKVTSLVYLGNNKVYSQVALELFSQSLHALYPHYPNYESYLFDVTPAIRAFTGPRRDGTELHRRN